MKFLSHILLISALSLMTLTGCGTKPSGQDKVLATVADKFITVKDFKYKLSRLPSYYKSVADRNKKTLLNDMIVESLFLEESVRKGLDRDKEIREVLNEAKKKIIMAKFVKTEVDDKVTVSEDEIKKFYDEHKEEFKVPGMWRASHILVASEGEANDILSEISKGRTFEELAKERSIDATAARLGDVGYFRKGQVIPEFENVCFNLKIGETSGIVHTQFGYHIIKLTDKKDEVIESYEEAKPMIENNLKIKKRNELFDKLVLELKDKYRVKVEEDALKILEAVNADKKDAENKQ